MISVAVKTGSDDGNIMTGARDKPFQQLDSSIIDYKRELGNSVTEIYSH